VLSVSVEFSRAAGRHHRRPFGSSVCLVIVALLLRARVLPHGPAFHIGDFYRKRYGRAMELGTSVIIAISYLGWTAAQLTALAWFSRH